MSEGVSNNKIKSFSNKSFGLLFSSSINTAATKPHNMRDASNEDTEIHRNPSEPTNVAFDVSVLAVIVETLFVVNCFRHICFITSRGKKWQKKDKKRRQKRRFYA